MCKPMMLPCVDVQDSNPRIKSGEIPPYTGIANCFSRVSAEQGAPEMHCLICSSFACIGACCSRGRCQLLSAMLLQVMKRCPEHLTVDI